MGFGSGSVSAFSDSRNQEIAMQNRSSTAHVPDRRRLTRYACQKTEAPPWIALLAPRTWPATVYDISATGAGILLSCAITPGTKVKLEFHDQADRSWRARIGQVVHCAPYDLHTWRIGFDFLDPFSEVELQQLLLSQPANGLADRDDEDQHLRPPRRSTGSTYLPTDLTISSPGA
jgi:hypothetical protein